MPPLLSILMPVHNEAAYLREALDSVLGATIPVEVVVVDDRSTDDTHAIATAFAASAPADVWVQVARNPGAGKVAAINHAYTLATGVAFVMLSGDDRIVPDLLAERAAAVRGRDGPAVAMCRYRTFSEEAAQDGILHPRLPGGDQIAGGAISFNRAFADIAFPTPGSLPNEDTWWRAVTLLLDVDVTLIQGIGLHYRIHAGNDTGMRRPYARLDQDMADRARALTLALTHLGDHATQRGRARLQTLIAAEAARTRGQWWRLAVMPGLAPGDRLTQMGNAGPGAYALKQALIRGSRYLRRG